MKTKYFSLLLILLGSLPLSAQIVYYNFNSSPHTFSIGTGALGPGTIIDTFNLPGANDLALYELTLSGNNYFQLVMPGGALATQLDMSIYFAESLNAPLTWADLGVHFETAWGNISRFNAADSVSKHLRSDPTYIPYQFADTSAGNMTKYGYITLTTDVTGSGASAQLNLKIYGYAYDNSGAYIQMGAVPEPSTYAMLALGVALLCTHLISRRRQIEV